MELQSIAASGWIIAAALAVIAVAYLASALWRHRINPTDATKRSVQIARRRVFFWLIVLAITGALSIWSIR